MASFATTDDLEAVWRPLTDPEIEAATKWLTWASALVRQQFPTIDTRLAAGKADPDLLGFVVVSMVKRVMERPGGVRQRSETLGAYTESETYDTAVSTGALYLSDSERATLDGPGGGAFTISTTSESVTAGDLEIIALRRAARGEQANLEDPELIALRRAAQ